MELMKCSSASIWVDLFMAFVVQVKACLIVYLNCNSVNAWEDQISRIWEL
jgi:hypothetical protein